MKTQNETKAKEIAQSVSFFWTNEEDGEKSIIDTISLRKAIFNAALEAMQWKDEQIDTIMLTIEGCLCSFFESQGNTQESIDNFIDAIKTQINENLNKQ